MKGRPEYSERMAASKNREHRFIKKMHQEHRGPEAQALALDSPTNLKTFHLSNPGKKQLTQATTPTWMQRGKDTNHSPLTIATLLTPPRGSTTNTL